MTDRAHFDGRVWRDLCGSHAYVIRLCTAETKAIEMWRAQHYAGECKLPPIKATAHDPLGLGGMIPEASYKIELRPNSIGQTVTVVCDCGATLDVTHEEHD